MLSANHSTMSLILNYVSAVTDTTPKDTFLPITTSQHGSGSSIWFPMYPVVGQSQGILLAG